MENEVTRQDKQRIEASIRGNISRSPPVREGSFATPPGGPGLRRWRALDLGAEKAKIIDTETVVLAEWVRWKCRYGCPLFEKDPFHPPFAPDAESTKKVLKEYTKAILLNGPNGQILSEAAVKLEGEAYHRSYYKAFALTALVPSGLAACAPPGPSPSPGAT